MDPRQEWQAHGGRLSLDVEGPWVPRWYHFVAIGLLPLASPYVLGPWLMQLGDRAIVKTLQWVFGGAEFGG